MVAAGRAELPLSMVGQFGGALVRMGGSETSLADLSDGYRATFERLFG
jgi:phosphoribosylformylglycinamidine synthase